MLSIKLDIIKCIGYDLAGYFCIWECSENFPYKLIVIASSLLYIISAYAKFHRNALLSITGNLYTPEAKGGTHRLVV